MIKIEKERKNIFVDLVRDGLLDMKNAAEKLGISQKEFAALI